MALGDALRKIIRNPIEGDSISSGSEPQVYSVAKRVQASVNAQEYVKRELSDLVAHKVSPKEVRYLDPKTTETVFTDKGESIRISGTVTQDKTEVMLRYAKEKYGGVLRLNGSEEFKLSCAMAAAEKGINVILKPEKYHEAMQTRIAEMQAETMQTKENTIVQENPVQEASPMQTAREVNPPEPEQERPVSEITPHVPEQPAPIVPEKQAEAEQPEAVLPSEPAVLHQGKSLAELQAEADKLAVQQRAAQQLLDDAVKNDAPSAEINVLTLGATALNSRALAALERVREAENAEIPVQNKTNVTQDERSLDKEIDRIAEKYATEFKMAKEDVLEAISYANIKDVEQFDKYFSEEETFEVFKAECANVQRDRENERAREQEYSRDNDRSL